MKTHTGYKRESGFDNNNTNYKPLEYAFDEYANENKEFKQKEEHYDINAPTKYKLS